LLPFAGMRNTPRYTTRHTEQMVTGLVVVLACVVLYLGFQTFWFLCDDAYIAWRYVNNSVAGHGWVWNPPPFQPVEGYTSVLWVMVCELAWRVTGVEPPVAANWICLGFGYGTMLLVCDLVLRWELPEPLRHHRPAVLAVVLLAILSNRTFLTWLSSGLETAMFNFLLTWWVVEALASRREWDWVLRWTMAAGLMALARPDGLLFCGATAVGLTVHLWADGARWRRLAWAWPLLVVPAHLGWRFSFYGQWLPNTYYAKHVAAWPSSGLEYAACFAIENGLAVWLLVLGAFAWRLFRAGGFDRSWWRTWGVSVVGGAAVLAHFLYYTVDVGGDHFEYRVYSQLVPLLALSLASMLMRLSPQPRVFHGVFATYVALSLPIPWVHHAATSDPARYETIVAINDRFPEPVRPLVAVWDVLQYDIQFRGVGMRRHVHIEYLRQQRKRWPSREDGLEVSSDGFPSVARGGVGIPGWVMPNVFIIDRFGLNDRVIAHNPATKPHRHMAHDRLPPEGYLECFEPNVTSRRGQLTIERRSREMTAERIEECERRDWY